MNKTLRRALTVSAAFLMLAGVSAGMGSLSTNNVHASRVYLDQYASRWERRDGITHWGVYPKRGFHRNPNGGIPLPNYYTRTFYKNGHSFIVKAIGSTPGEIIGMDGTTHVSSARVCRALAPHHYRRVHRHHAKRHARRHIRERARRHGRRSHHRHSHRRY